jgi:formylmethanofuran dehydrogenase subunit E
MSEDEIDPRELIIALRGGVPAICDFCGKERAPETLHPEEGGEWVCMDCLERWQREGQ